MQSNVTRKFRMLLGILLFSIFFTFVVPEVAPTLPVPQVAQAQAASPVSWRMDLSNGGPVINGQPSTVRCDSIPCNVSVKVTDPNGQTISSVDWYEDDDMGATQHHVTTGPEYPASWSYPESGTKNLGYIATFSDGSSTSGGVTIEIRDPVDANATVAYVGPSELVTADDWKNVFRVDYTGRNYAATVFPQDGSRYTPVVVPLPNGQPNPWTDESGVKHVILRANKGVPGPANIRLESGVKGITQPVTLVGQPPALDDEWKSPKVGMYKSGTQCVVTIKNTATRTSGADFVTDMKFDRKVGKKYKKVRNVLGRKYNAKVTTATAVTKIYWSKSQIKKTPKVRLRLTQHVFPAKSAPLLFTLVPPPTLDLKQCRR